MYKLHRAHVLAAAASLSAEHEMVPLVTDIDR